MSIIGDQSDVRAQTIKTNLCFLIIDKNNVSNNKYTSVFIQNPFPINTSIHRVASVIRFSGGFYLQTQRTDVNLSEASLTRNRTGKMMHEIIQYKIMFHTYSCCNYMWIGSELEQLVSVGEGKGQCFGPSSTGHMCEADESNKMSLI